MAEKSEDQSVEATTVSTQSDALKWEFPESVPGLVLAWNPADLVTHDRIALEKTVTIGRSSSTTWCIPDNRLSRIHFQIEGVGHRFLIRDNGSRNGTFINGHLLTKPSDIGVGDLVRAGNCVFVLVEDLNEVSHPTESTHETYGLAGKFHTHALVRQLRVAARTGRHVLLSGESGSGKELVAHALHGVLCELGRKGPWIAQNAACYGGEDDAVGTLLGVSKGAFTGVSQRKGTLEQAAGGTLFLDEVHNLPGRVQRTLLRFLEDGLVHALGGAGAQKVDVLLVFGTNVDVEGACDKGQLAHDLIARLHRVSVPPLRHRRADIPSIFVHLIQHTLEPDIQQSVVSLLDASVFEHLCCRNYERGNVRELQDLVAIIGARIAEGESPPLALAQSIKEITSINLDSKGSEVGRSSTNQLSESDSLYEHHRNDIVEAYREVGDNLTKLEEKLRGQGIQCNRRWLGVFLERWGIRPVRRK